MAIDIPKMGNIVKPYVAQHGARLRSVKSALFPAMGTTSNLRSLRRQRKWTLEKAATEFGMSRGGYIKLERGERRLTVDRIKKAAVIYDVSTESVVGNHSTQIVGSVRSGGIVELHNASGVDVHVPSPPDGSSSAKALVVDGGVLPGLAEDQWLVFFDYKEDGLPEDRLGQLCVLAIDGGVSLRIGRAYRGRLTGEFDIVTPGYEPMKGVRIAWSAEVTWVKPR